MRTRCKDLAGASRPAYSFQYLTGDCGWADPVHVDGTVMVWNSQAARDRARGCFTSRKVPERAYGDLRTNRLIPTKTN